MKQNQFHVRKKTATTKQNHKERKRMKRLFVPRPKCLGQTFDCYKIHTQFYLILTRFLCAGFFISSSRSFFAATFQQIIFTLSEKCVASTDDTGATKHKFNKPFHLRNLNLKFFLINITAQITHLDSSIVAIDKIFSL